MSEHDFYVEVGKRLSDHRKLKNLTQKKVGELIGVSQETLSLVESGARRPSVLLLKQLCVLYDITYDKIFGTHQITNIPDKPLKSIKSVDLLKQLCEGSGSKELEQTVRAYIDMCVYYMLREVYESNPKNSGRLFKTEKETAYRELIRFVEKTPLQLSAFIKASASNIKRNELELPLEKAADLREYIKQSEDLIFDMLTKQ